MQRDPESTSGFRVSINISQVQASKSDVIQDISAEMKRAGLSLEALIVELTESDLWNKISMRSIFSQN